MRRPFKVEFCISLYYKVKCNTLCPVIFALIAYEKCTFCYVLYDIGIWMF